MFIHPAATRTLGTIGFSFILAFALCVPASAVESGDPWDGDVHPSFTVYGWLPGVSSNLRFQLDGQDIENKSNNNILDNLSGAFMLEGDIRKGNWGLYGDFDWVEFEDEKGRLREVGGNNIGGDLTLDTSWGLKGGMLTLAGLYTVVHGESGYADLLFGVRHLWLEGNLSWDFGLGGDGGSVGIENQGEVSRDADVTAAIVGTRGRWILNDGPFFVPYYLDVGWASSAFTAQAAAGIGYAFDSVDFAFVWRHVRYSQDDDDAFLRRVDFDGPSFNLGWQF